MKGSETHRIVVGILQVKGWTQRRLADTMGVSIRQVARWSSGEQDTSPMRLSQLQRIRERAVNRLPEGRRP